MNQVTLNIRSKRRPGEIFSTVTRSSREICLSYARSTFPAETHLWDWEDGTLLDQQDAWRLLPRDIARAVAKAMPPADLAACLDDALADNEKRAPGTILAAAAAYLEQNSSLDAFVALHAMTAAVEREAAMRFQAVVTGWRADSKPTGQVVPL